MKILIVSNQVPEELVASKSMEIRTYLQDGYKCFLQPSVVVSQLSNCWKIGDKISDFLLGNNKHRWKGLNSEEHSPEGMVSQINKQGHEIVLTVVHYQNKKKIVTMLKQLGCSGKKNFSQITQMRLANNIIGFNQSNNSLVLF